MSRAFVKEPDGSEPFTDAPEKQVSQHPNYVTANGLALIEAEMARLTLESSIAQTSGDRAALSATARDLRYWQARRASADVVPPPSHTAVVQFGSTASIAREDGRRQVFRITGEDEANPAQGSISYVSPLARALMGKSVGEVIRLGAAEVEIVAIE